MKLIPMARNCQCVAASNFEETKKSSIIDEPAFGSFVSYKFNVINVIRGTITSQNFLRYMKDVREVTRCGTRAESQESIACRKRSM